MVRRVHVATDFSAAAGRAVGRAVLLAKAPDVELTVVHVVPERALLDRLFQRHELDYDAMTAGAQHALRDVVDELARGHGVRAGSALLQGAAERAIVTAAAAAAADLLVVGALGEGADADADPGLDHAAPGAAPDDGRDALGGTALKCFLRTALPLLLVRRPVRGDYQKVVIAIHALDAAPAMLDAALAWSPGAAHEILHAIDVPFAARLRAQNTKEATIDAYAARERERWERDLAALAREHAGDAVQPVVARGGSPRAIVRAIAERQPDLVVVGRRAPPGERAFDDLDSVSFAVAQRGAYDVLLMP
jgi:nucleotide-binding universal stress UspA family protein